MFLRTDLPADQAGRQLAAAIGLTVTEESNGQVILSTDMPGRPGMAGGRVTANIYGNEPGEPSVLDGYDTAWEIRTTTRDPNDVHRESERLFNQLIDQIPWPVLLVRSLTWLVSAWSPQLGRRDFPDGTTPDAKHQERWSRFALTS
jgi:hypothetical protein